MALPAFGASGTIAESAATGSVSVTGPTCNAGDLLIAAINAQSNATITLPAGWVSLDQNNNTTGQSVLVAWKLATKADSAATFIFSNGDAAHAITGVISSWTGVNLQTPVDTSGATYVNTAAANDAVSFASIACSSSIGGTLVAYSFYNLAACAFSVPVGMTLTSGPTIQSDQNSTLVDICLISGTLSSNAQIGASTAASNSTVDAINVGAVLFLLAANAAESTGGGGSPTYGTKQVTRATRMRGAPWRVQ